MSTKTHVKLPSPVDTLGSLISVLEDFRAKHPNQSEVNEPRKIRLHLTMGGALKGFTVEDG